MQPAQPKRRRPGSQVDRQVVRAYTQRLVKLERQHRLATAEPLEEGSEREGCRGESYGEREPEVHRKT